MKNLSKRGKFILATFLLPVLPCLILLFKGHNIGAIALAATFWTLSILGIFSKKFVEIIFEILRIMGETLSKIVLGLIWILFLLPLAIVMKTAKRDRLLLKKCACETYWKDELCPESNWEYQF